MQFYYRLEQKTDNCGQGKYAAVWKVVSLVAEQSATRRCDLDSNSPDTAFGEVTNLSSPITHNQTN